MLENEKNIIKFQCLFSAFIACVANTGSAWLTEQMTDVIVYRLYKTQGSNQIFKEIKILACVIMKKFEKYLSCMIPWLLNHFEYKECVKTLVFLFENYEVLAVFKAKVQEKINFWNFYSDSSESQNIFMNNLQKLIKNK